MKFNYEKFHRGMNNSFRYDQWNKELLDTLDKAGTPCPTHDYAGEYHSFSFLTRREPTKAGRHRQSLDTKILCYHDGRIEIEPDDKMKPNEITSVCKQVIHFFAVMQSAGYIID